MSTEEIVKIITARLFRALRQHYLKIQMKREIVGRDALFLSEAATLRADRS